MAGESDAKTKAKMDGERGTKEEIGSSGGGSGVKRMSSSGSPIEKGTKKRTSKVGQACIFCRRSHMTCDAGRPCQRCIKRDIGHLCRDETTSRISSGSHAAAPKNAVRRSSSTHSIASSSSPLKHETTFQPPSQPQAHVQQTSTPLPASAIINVLAGAHLGPSSGSRDPMLGMIPSQAQASGVNSNGGLNGGMPQHRFPFHPDMIQANALLSAQPTHTANNTINSSWVASMLGGASFLGLGGGDPIGAGSGFAASGDAAGGNEYNILSEFLESLDGTSALPTPAAPSNAEGTGAGATSNVPASETSADAHGAPTEANGASRNGVENSTVGSQATHSLARNRRMSLADPAPSLSGTSKTENFFLTAADQKDGTRDERLGRVIQAKLDAGLLRPYNHVKGYARLNQWMEQNCNQASRRRILKPLSIFRPAFRAVAQRLTNVDLIFIEEAFERLLLDYDRVFSTQGIPACLWRRTGEIYKGNREFADLVGVDFEALRDGQCTIYELMQEESAVNYWEKYGAVCFDPGQKAVLTSCVLKTNNHKKARLGTMSAPRSGLATPLPPKDSPSKATTPAPPASTSESTLNVSEKKTQPAKALNGKADNATIAESQQQQPTQAGSELYMACCFSFTIRRDSWGIPYAIVGNFLPLVR